MAGIPNAPAAGGPPEVALDIEGVVLRLLVFEDPSGLRGQVFDGEEKVAGVQIFHTQDVNLLVDRARRDRAVRRHLARLAGSPS